MPKPTEVYFQLGRSRVFACAVEWPGWCRRAKTEEEALDALAEYAVRYAPIVAAAGAPLPKTAADSFEVVERIDAPPGKSFSGVDFGTIDAACERDRRPLTAAQASRLAGIVEASWRALDDVVAHAPAELRKGPRGGGRDRDKVYAHVLGAEAAYARKIGVRHKVPSPDDGGAVAELRADIGAALTAARAAEPLTANGWLPRYAARRIAWHVLDHAWEIEDRSN
jgi:predicted RNase H-like HicB family nuclease